MVKKAICFIINQVNICKLYDYKIKDLRYLINLFHNNLQNIFFYIEDTGLAKARLFYSDICFLDETINKLDIKCFLIEQGVSTFALISCFAIFKIFIFLNGYEHYKKRN